MIEEELEQNESIREGLISTPEGDITRAITLDVEKLKEEGVKDIGLFLEGVLNSLDDGEFNDSHEDYIKGYKYGKTGKFLS